jgi:hypothetical protein
MRTIPRESRSKAQTPKSREIRASYRSERTPNDESKRKRGNEAGTKVAKMLRREAGEVEEQEDNRHCHSHNKSDSRVRIASK